MNAPFFQLPDGSPVNEITLVSADHGEIKFFAGHADERQKLLGVIGEHEDKLRYHQVNRMPERLRTLLSRYESIASDALSGAESVRADMLAYLRSVVFVLETVTGDHLNHFQKNERIRGAMCVLEKHISSLRDEKFRFADAVWRRSPDLFRWNEGEKRLRERVRELERELEAARKETGKANSEEAAVADGDGEMPF